MRCAILCSGLSARDCDLSKIDVPIIGVNWSFLGRQPDVHVISNKILIAKHGNELPTLTPNAWARFAWLPARGAYTPRISMKYASMKPVDRKWRIPKMPFGYNLFRDGWVFGGGGPCALQVAVTLGFDDIIFVGLDLCHGDDFHFYSLESQLFMDRSEFSGYTRQQLEDAWTVQKAYFDQVLPSVPALVRNTGLADVGERTQFKDIWL